MKLQIMKTPSATGGTTREMSIVPGCMAIRKKGPSLNILFLEKNNIDLDEI